MKTAIVTAVVLILSLTFDVNAQYKVVFQIDDNDVTNVSSMKVSQMVSFNDGSGSGDLLLVGDYSGKDNLNQTISPFYFIKTNILGYAWESYYYKDATPNAPVGSRSYCAAYDSISGLYVGGSSNLNQIVSRVDHNGNVLWSLNTGHHEIQSLLFDYRLNALVIMGQGESVTNGHDYYVAIVDTSGVVLKAYNFGTTLADSPSKIIATPSGYLLTGTIYNSPLSEPFFLSLDTALNILWSKTYSPNNASRNYFVNDAINVDDNHVILGYTRGGGSEDSLFYLKIDENGVPLEYKVFMTDVPTSIQGNALAYNPSTQKYFIGGNYSPTGTGYRQPFVMQCDANGQVLWAKDYGDGIDSTDETIQDILLFEDSSFFLASGNYLYKNDQGNFMWNVFMVKGLNDGLKTECDSILNVNVFNRNIAVQVTGMASRELFSYNTPYNMVSVETGVFDFYRECDILNSIDEVDTYHVNTSLFPNPASSFIKIKSDKSIKAITIYDIYGRAVVSKENFVSEYEFNTTIDISNVQQGIYLVVCTYFKSKGKETIRLVVTR